MQRNISLYGNIVPDYQLKVVVTVISLKGAGDLIFRWRYKKDAMTQNYHRDTQKTTINHYLITTNQ